jgi:anti-sigma factor RsiW
MPTYLEGGLPEPERCALEAHIARCPHCPALVQAMWALLSVLADGKGVPEEVLARFRTRAKAIAHGTLGDPPLVDRARSGDEAVDT